MLTRLADARASVRSYLSDEDPNDYVWPTVDINAYIKDGYQQFCATVKPIFDREAIPDVEGEALYDLPLGMVSLERVTYKDIRIGSAPASFLEQKDSSFEDQTGEVFSFLLDGDGYGKIRKIRVPAADNADNFYIEYTRLGAELESDDTEFDIPEWYVAYVEYFALFRCYDRRGRGQNTNLAKHFRSRWAEGLERASEKSLSIGSRGPRVLGGGGRRGVAIPRGPRLPANFGRTVPKRGW